MDAGEQLNMTKISSFRAIFIKSHVMDMILDVKTDSNALINNKWRSI